MRCRRVVLFVLAVQMAASSAAAQEVKRFALLIGNQGYSDKVGALKNPHNDIAAVGTALESVGFKVTTVREAGRRQVLSAVKAFAARLATAGSDAVGFFYYSGHGVSRPDDRANYLIPVDLKDTESADFWFDTVKLDDLLGELERVAPNAAHFIVFDACRNELKLPEKSAVKGFEPVAERSGMFIAFATALGAVASDRGESSGPYAGALAAELVKPGQDHLQLFQNVKEGVFTSTGRRQVPWERNGLLRRVHFGGEVAAAKPSPPVAPAPAPQLSGNEAAQAWAAAKETTDTAILEAFIKHYGDTFYGALARSRLAELTKQAGEAAEKQKLVAAKAAEDTSKAAEVKRQEEDRRAREAALVEARIAKETADAAESKRVAAAKAEASQAAEEALAKKKEAEKSKDAARVAVVPKNEKLKDPRQFDGNWDINWTSSNCPLSSGTYPIRIVNGAIQSSRHVSSGRVSGDGTANWIRITHGASPYRGTFRGNSGSGTHANPKYNCGGAFTATRN